MKQDKLDALKQIKKDAQDKHKGKKFGTLSTKEKDELLKTIAKMLGLIE
jgi:hypothetical protein